MMAKKKEQKEDRKSVIRDAFLKVTEKYKPQIVGESVFTRSFDMRKVVDLPEVRGELRQHLTDFKPEDKKDFREVLQDLKHEGVIFHKAAHFWVRNE